MYKQTSILKSSFWSYLGIFVLLIAGLVTNVVLARLLDKELWGIFSTLIAVVSFISTVSELGINYYITYITAKFSDSQKQLKDKLARPLQYKFIMLFILSFLFVVFSSQLAEFFHIQNGSKYFVASAFYLFFINVFTVLENILFGLKKFKEDAVISTGHYLIRLVLASLLVLSGFGLDGAIIGYIAAVAVSTIIQYYILRSIISLSGKSQESFSEIFSYGFYVGLTNIAATFSVWTDSVMIGFFIGTTSVGIYRIAVSLASASSSLLNGISRVMFPYFTSEESKGRDSIEQFNKAMKYTLFISIPAFFGLIICSEGIVKGFFGMQYIDSTIPLMILSYLVLDGVLVGLISSYLAAKRMTKIIGYSSAISAVLNVLLNLILIPILGMIGAAITSVFSRIINLMLLVFWSKDKVKAKYEFQFKLPLIGSLIMAAVLLLLKQYVNPAESLLHLFFFILFGIAVYLVSEQLLGFDVIGFGKKIAKALMPEKFLRYLPMKEFLD